MTRKFQDLPNARPLAWQGVERRAHPRHRISLPARFVPESGAPLATEVVDISAGGLRLASCGAIRPGSRGVVSVEGLLGPLPCTVMGTEGGALRLRFDALEALGTTFLERLAALPPAP
ncbi:PilZ domain-containing protein [Falsiroseomonas oryziterrae]|uniref:PilZ domain-containing protein n=1 Tax=Falsiroseomonas oryziterrae TaxID=2911368 RepID=UPI001F2FA77C|nr:PilZ domain-containing protein [Roseomonas sp. NPKOSM-4]